MTDEDLVKKHWRTGRVSNASDEDGVVPHAYEIVGIPGAPNNWHHTPEEAWSAAAEFTRERLEEIRQLKEEITLVTFHKRTDAASRFAHNEEPWSRILVRLQRELDNLQRGMIAE